jgi:serine/threonine-protein kinase RsbW
VSDPLHIRLVLPKVARAELLAVQAVEELGRRAGLSHDTLAEVKLAVVEACLNAFEYGAGDVVVDLVAHRDDDAPWLEVEVEDHGPGFSPAKVPRPALESKLRARRKRGWGLELMRRLMDQVEISSQPGLTRVRMVRRWGGK